MAKVLTKDDFEGGEISTEETSEKTIPADQKFDQDGKEVVEEPEEKVVPDEETKVEPQSKSYKYASMDDYDKAYKEAEKKMHEATMRASSLEKELGQVKKPPEKVVTADDKIAEFTDAALNEIKGIKLEYDEEGNITRESASKRDREAAIIWGKAQRKISRLEIDEVNKVALSEREIVNKTYTAAQKEGIMTDAELRILGHEFSKTDPSVSTDDRIKESIESTKGILSQIRDGFIKNQEKDKKEKEDLKVLGRGSTRKESKGDKESKPSTMSQQLSELNEKRRMTKDDLR